IESAPGCGTNDPQDLKWLSERSHQPKGTIMNRLLCGSALLAAGMLLFGQGSRADEKGAVVTLGELKSAAPADWKSQPPSNKFRAHQFAVGDAELVIFYFGGSGG